LSSLAIAVLSLASPSYGTIDPNADVLYHPVTLPTSETTLTQQVSATHVAVQGAYGDPNDVPPDSSLYADSHSEVVSKYAGGGTPSYFSLSMYNPNDADHIVQGNPAGQLEGVMLYVTVTLASGRQVLDNEDNEAIAAATVDIGVSLSLSCLDPVIGPEIGFMTNPRVSNAGSLAADSNDPPPFADIYTMTDEELDWASYGDDRLAAVIDPDDANNQYQDQPIYTITDPDMLAAFTGDGEIMFSYLSLPTTSHFVGDQNFVEWSVSPTFEMEARVVYLYTGVPEPASLGLLSAALLPALTKRIRKRKQIRN